MQLVILIMQYYCSVQTTLHQHRELLSQSLILLLTPIYYDNYLHVEQSIAYAHQSLQIHDK